MNNSDQIRIKIQDSLSANAFNEGSRLHQGKYDKVTSLIDDQLNIAEKYPNKLDEFSKLGESYIVLITLFLFLYLVIEELGKHHSCYRCRKYQRDELSE